jgi:V/A-type H+-transporting ATPase subunit A
VLQEFPELLDPYSGEPLMLRTVLIANTSNMPVAAREASVYTGITLAEYYRDMGYNVALQADSTSRWAEALREISGRLEEMPGEEGYPAYLGTRMAAFYERAGRVACLGTDRREGSICAIGSVSPPGGDLSEPVTQSTLRVVKVFWALEDRLAFARHFPAISWLNSYSLYIDETEEYWEEAIDPRYAGLREKAMSILQKEAELLEIVRLIGMEALSDQERLIMETAKSLREDFLQQNAFDNADAFTSLKKQFLLLKLIMRFNDFAAGELEKGIEAETLFALPVMAEIAKAKFIPEDDLDRFSALEEEIVGQLAALASDAV